MNRCLSSRLVAIALGLVCLATTLSPQVVACDQCGHSSCSSCSQSMTTGCTSCGGGCDGACQSSTTCYTVHCDDEGILDKSATVLKAIHHRAKSLFGIRKRGAGCDSCDQANCDSCPTGSCSQPTCGVEAVYAPRPTYAEPDCGCEQNVATGSCGCYEVTVCDAGTSRGLLAKFFKERENARRSCDHSPSCGCEISEPSCGVETNLCDSPPEPSCGCESQSKCECGPSRSGGLLEELLRRRRAALSAPSCGCETSPSCGSEISPSCGCESTSSCSSGSCSGGSLFGKLFSKREAGCDCQSTACEAGPSCGCESPVATPSCGCESNYTEPGCGAEASISDGCTSCQQGASSHTHAYSQPHQSVQPYVAPEYTQPQPHYHSPQVHEQHLANPAPVVDPHVAAPGVTPTPIQPSPVQPEVSSPYRTPAQPPVELQPVPAPAPPTVPRSNPPSSIRSVPDSEINPFLDDAVNRVRRVPTRPVNYRMNSRAETPSAVAPYGDRYDPQASNSRNQVGVRLRLSDVFEKLDANETSRPEPVLARTLVPQEQEENVVAMDDVWQPRSKRNRRDQTGQGREVITASATGY